jgi:hypothetical protein
MSFRATARSAHGHLARHSLRIYRFVLENSLSTTAGHGILEDVLASMQTLEPYLTQMRDWPFVRQVLVNRGRHTKAQKHDLSVTLKTPNGSVRYDVQLKATNVNRTLAAAVISSFQGQNIERQMLFAHYIPPTIADELAKKGVQFVDRAGNQHLRIADRYFVRTTGRPPLIRAVDATPTQATGYLVYFALLADPSLRDAPVRDIGAAVGVSKSAVSKALGRMQHERLLVQTKGRRRWIDADKLIDRWLTGYADIVRPKLFVGGYKTQDADPQQLEARLEVAMPSAARWAFGGGSAAYRLTRHFRGSSTVIHVADPPADLARTLRALPVDQDPALVVLRVPGPLLLAGAAPGTAHPLLVYSELLSVADDRAREAAAQIRERYLSASKDQP